MGKQDEKERVKAARKALKPVFRSLTEAAVKAHDDGKPVMAMVGLIPFGPMMVVKLDVTEVDLGDVEARLAELAKEDAMIVHGPEI